MKQKAALEKCPCGNTVLNIVESFMDETVTVECPKCGRTTGERESREEAIRVWNRRAEDELPGKAGPP